MKKLLLAAALSLSAISAQAAVLTFDDVPGASQNSYGAIPTYQGFTFGTIGGLNRLDWIDTVGSAWNYGAVSGEFTMLNNYGGTGVVRAADGSDFSYDGLWARTWGNTTGGRAASIQGFNNGVAVWTESITLTSVFTQFAGMTGAIDELRLNLGNYFLVDNLSLNEPGGQVPEPASLALLGLGVMGLVATRRRKA